MASSTLFTAINEHLQQLINKYPVIKNDAEDQIVESIAFAQERTMDILDEKEKKVSSVGQQLLDKKSDNRKLGRRYQTTKCGWKGGLVK